MSVFGKKNGRVHGGAGDTEAISSLIDKSMTITGMISFAGKARIDGLITGNIEGEHLILSDTGKIIGNVKAASFNCHGTLEGDIQANSVIARKSCSIHGKLEAASLTVEPGAAIDGEIKAAAKDVRQQIEGKNRVQLPSPPSPLSNSILMASTPHPPPGRSPPSQRDAVHPAHEMPALRQRSGVF